MSKCNGIKASGERCRGIAKAGSDYCPAHDPARAEERRRVASKAGKIRTGGEISEIKARLRELAEDVVADRITTAKGSVAAQILGVYLRAVEQERKQREYDELRGEMVELREMLEQGQGSAGGRQCTG